MTTPASPPSRDQPSTATRILRGWIRLTAISLIATGLPAAVAGPWVVTRLTDVARRADIAPDQVPALVRHLGDHPMWMVLAAVPAMACGVLALLTKRFAAPLVTTGMICLIAAMGLILYCFVMLLAPMYTYQEL